MYFWNICSLRCNNRLCRDGRRSCKENKNKHSRQWNGNLLKNWEPAIFYSSVTVIQKCTLKIITQDRLCHHQAHWLSWSSYFDISCANEFLSFLILPAQPSFLCKSCNILKFSLLHKLRNNFLFTIILCKTFKINILSKWVKLFRMLLLGF